MLATTNSFTKGLGCNWTENPKSIWIRGYKARVRENHEFEYSDACEIVNLWKPENLVLLTLKEMWYAGYNAAVEQELEKEYRAAKKVTTIMDTQNIKNFLPLMAERKPE
jgi:hypothetical protein